ncbi:MAG: hypothetical protein FWH47_06490, partial [Methanomassiliicoccaceae archaeon]|nr:hypothetical protein [Methanomassiliicoccaceae archaeon]
KLVGLRPADEEGVAAAVRILVLNGRDEAASAIVENALRALPSSVPLLITKKELCSARGDQRAVIDACRGILAAQPDNSMVRNDLAEAYAATGDVGAASRMYLEIGPAADKAGQGRQEAPVAQRQKAPETIKRYAERVLRRAYISRLSLSDPSLIEALDIDEATARAIMAYLSDIAEYGDISPGTPEFERMEKLSFNAVTKGNCTGLESEPVITIPCAYVAGGAKDADEAKLLVAYVYKALSSRKSSKGITPELRKMAEGTKKGTPIDEIMRAHKIGAYQAKQVRDSL